MDDDIASGWPLFEGKSLGDLRMPVECKALTSAARHVVREHGVSVSAFSDDTGLSGRDLLAAHLEAHGLPAEGDEVQRLVPFDVMGGVHRLAEADGDLGTLTNSVSSGFRLANPTQEQVLAAVRAICADA